MPSISINTNLSSLIAQQSLKQSSNKLNLAVERMSTGFKINHAKDNAANYSISTNMTTKIGAYQVAEDNVAMGLDLLSTANGSLDQISDKLSRLRALAEQSANGTYGGGKSKLAINAEANSLVDEIERLYNTTTYNGINLSKGKIETSNFIKDIERRDTSKMDKFEEVKIDEALTTGTYSISTAEGLAKLATMTNNGLIGANTEFVLANDIDLKEWCEANSATGGWVPIGTGVVDVVDFTKSFQGNFDGNGYAILNLYSNNPNSDYIGLFGVTYYSNIKNLSVTEANITGGTSKAIMIGYARYSHINNCSVKGSINGEARNTGGLVGFIHDGEINDCFSYVNIKSKDSCNGGIAGVAYRATIKGCVTQSNIETTIGASGGLVGFTNISCNIENCSTKVKFTTTKPSTYLGGLVGFVQAGTLFINNCNVENLSNTNGMLDGVFVGYTSANNDNISVQNCSYNKSENNITISLVNVVGGISNINIAGISFFESGNEPFIISNNAMVSSYDENAVIGLQVGAKGDWASALSVELGYRLDGISALRNIGTGNDDYLSKVDTLIDSISAKAVEFGSAQNRLESALDEISTQYENLVSSRSTLRDADISEVSSEYIRQQILQEASATLMSTANQNPSIALQLL